MIVAGGLLALEPIAKNRLASGASLRDNLTLRAIAKQVAEYGEETRGSALGRLIADCRFSPREDLPDDLRGLSHPWTKAPSRSELAIDEHRAAR